MKKIFSVILVLFFSILFNNILYSIQDLFPDNRSIGMGGAYTGFAEDSMTQYHNPAGLHSLKGFGLQFYAPSFEANLTQGFNYMLGNLIAFSTGFAKIQEAQETGGYIDLPLMHTFAQCLKLLQDIDKPGNGFMINAPTGLQAYVGSSALSINGYLYSGVQPIVDLSSLMLHGSSATVGIDFSKILDKPGISTATPSVSLLPARDNISDFVEVLVTTGGASTGGLTFDQIANALVNDAKNSGLSDQEIIIMASDLNILLPFILAIYESGGTFTLSENESGFTIRGMGIVEFAVGFGAKADALMEGLTIGVNLRYLAGLCAYKRITLADVEEAGTVEFTPEDNTSQSATVGIDIGFLLDRKEDLQSKFGLTFKNINTPSFTPPKEAIPYNEKFELSPNIKAGVSFWPIPMLAIAMDMELFKTPTLVDGYYTQMWSGGVELNLLNNPYINVMVRGGLKKNLAEPRSGQITTLGVGVSLASLTLDVSIGYNDTPLTVELPDVNIPSTQVVISGSLSMRFQ